MMFRRDDPEMNKLMEIIGKYSELGAVAEFEQDGDLFVVTVRMKANMWRTECATLAEAISELNKHLEEDKM